MNRNCLHVFPFCVRELYNKGMVCVCIYRLFNAQDLLRVK